MNERDERIAYIQTALEDVKNRKKLNDDKLRSLRCEKSEWLMARREENLKEASRIFDREIESLGTLIRSDKGTLVALETEIINETYEPTVPYGTYVEWEYTTRTPFGGAAARTDHSMKKTGRVGVIEIFNHGSEQPDNVTRFSRPDVGDTVLRFLKKDGTPGKRTMTIFQEHQYDFKDWFLEGVDMSEGTV